LLGVIGFLPAKGLKVYTELVPREFVEVMDMPLQFDLEIIILKPAEGPPADPTAESFVKDWSPERQPGMVEGAEPWTGPVKSELELVLNHG